MLSSNHHRLVVHCHPHGLRLPSGCCPLLSRLSSPPQSLDFFLTFPTRANSARRGIERRIRMDTEDASTRRERQAAPAKGVLRGCRSVRSAGQKKPFGMVKEVFWQGRTNALARGLLFPRQSTFVNPQSVNTLQTNGQNSRFSAQGAPRTENGEKRHRSIQFCFARHHESQVIYPIYKLPRRG